MPHLPTPALIWFTDLIRVDQRALHTAANCFSFSPLNEKKKTIYRKRFWVAAQERTITVEDEIRALESRRKIDFRGSSIIQGMKWNVIVWLACGDVWEWVCTSLQTCIHSVYCLCICTQQSFCVCAGICVSVCRQCACCCIFVRTSLVFRSYQHIVFLLASLKGGWSFKFCFLSLRLHFGVRVEDLKASKCLSDHWPLSEPPPPIRFIPQFL